MASVSRVVFTRYLRTFDADDLERFVADLWRARGWTAVPAEGSLVVEHPTRGDRRTIAVRAVKWWRPSTSPPTGGDADLTVVNRPCPGAPESVVDAVDLHEMVHYAIDADARADLLARVHDRSGSLTDRAIRRVPPVSAVQAVAVFLSASVLVAAVAGLTLLPTGVPAPAADGGATPRSGTAGDVDDRTEATPPGGPVNPEVYPPGLAAGGVTDPAALAATHAERVADRPRVLTLRVEKYEDSRRWATYVERVAVRDDETFVSEIEFQGNPRGFPPVTAATEVYAAGGSVDVNVEPTLATDHQAAPRAAPNDPSWYTRRLLPAIERALSINGTDVVAVRRGPNGTVYHIAGAVHRGLGGEDRAVTARVTSTGTIRALRHEYDLPVSDGSINVTIGYEFEEVAVERPTWVDGFRETD